MRWICSCRQAEDDPAYHRRGDEEFLPIRLNAGSREMLVRQVIAQVAGKTRGYLPKTDLREAVRHLRPEARP